MRAAISILAFGAALVILVWTAPGSVRNAYSRVRTSVTWLPRFAWLERRAAADVRLGETLIPNGALYLPKTFRASDEKYDLVVHFHGNVGLVEESFELAGIDAAVVVMNLGTGTGAYDQYVSNTAAMPALLARVEDELRQRGVENPRLGRVALTAWSAGYGAVARILESGVFDATLDAIILLDGFHSSYDGNHHVEATRLAPFETFAKSAMRGERLFVITHSEVETYTYPTSRETTDALLGMLGLERTKGGTTPDWPALEGNHGVRRDQIPPPEPTTECRAGAFIVRGFSGGTKFAHMAHLIYMSTLALPELARRWETSNGAKLTASPPPVQTR